MKEFQKLYNEYNYVYHDRLDPKTSAKCKLPVPTGKARSIKSITWSAATWVKVTATISSELDASMSQWEELKPGTTLSPAITAMKFENTGTGYAHIDVRVIME